MTRHRLAITIAAFAVLATFAKPARAQAPDDDRWIAVPDHCRAFAAVPEDDPRLWNARLSLAACMLDLGPTFTAPDDDALDDAMHAMAVRAMPALFVYEDLVANGPPPVRFRAAYHIALVMEAMITRARAALPRDCSAERRAGLEERLTSSAHALRTVLESLDAIAADEPETIADPVNRAIARAVHIQVASWR